MSSFYFVGLERYISNSIFLGLKKWIRFIHITFKQYDRITKQKNFKDSKAKNHKVSKIGCILH